MIIYKIPVGLFQANCYLAADENTKETIIIDPGDEPEKIIDAVNENGLVPKLIILTHSHTDHVGAVEEIKKYFGVDFTAVNGGDKIKIGKIEFEIIETAGHTTDSICIISGSVIFTGDTLFKNSIGRTDFPGGDNEVLKKSLVKLIKYPDNFKVYPGHGPETTIGKEKTNNPFLRNT